MCNMKNATTYITVNPLVLSAQIMACKVHVRTGGAMKLTRNAPTVKKLRDMYGLPPSIRTYAQALDCLLEIQQMVDAEMLAAAEAASRV